MGSKVKKLDSADVSVPSGKLRPVKRIKAKKQRRVTF